MNNSKCTNYVQTSNCSNSAKAYFIINFFFFFYLYEFYCAAKIKIGCGYLVY